MTIYIKKAPDNKGSYSIRIEGVKPSGQSEPAKASYVQVTSEPQPFADDIGKHILNTHAKFVMRTRTPKVVSKPARATSRIPCPGCDKTYASETTLTRHVNIPDVHSTELSSED